MGVRRTLWVMGPGRQSEDMLLLSQAKQFSTGELAANGGQTWRWGGANMPRPSMFREKSKKQGSLIVYTNDLF